MDELTNLGNKAIPALEKIWLTGTDSRIRARAFWILVNMQGNDPAVYFDQAMKDHMPEIRILGNQGFK
jgi:hypothetical protein